MLITHPAAYVILSLEDKLKISLDNRIPPSLAKRRATMFAWKICHGLVAVLIYVARPPAS